MAMPSVEFGGETRSYDRFAEDTFTNALLVIRDGKIVFEDYRNKSGAQTHFISFSMAKTITAMLAGIALEQGKIASLDDRADKYVPELKGTGYDGVTIRQIMEMRSGVDYQERYDFGDHPSFAGKLHEQAIILNKMRFADGALQTKRANAPGSTSRSQWAFVPTRVSSSRPEVSRSRRPTVDTAGSRARQRGGSKS